MQNLSRYCVQFLIACLFCVPAHVFSENTPALSAKILVEDSTFDFGTVSQGSKVKHEFLVKNIGSSNLQLNRIIPSCGCTAVAVDNSTIKPNESGKVQVEFNTSGFSGEKVKTVRLYTNDPEHESTMLTMKGTIEPDVMVDPQRVYFGDVTKGAEGSSTKSVVQVRVRAGSKIQITSVRSYSPYLKVSDIEQTTESRKFSVAIDPTAPIGDLRDRIIVSLSGGSNNTINVPVFASVKGSLRVDPTTLYFGVFGGKEEDSIQRSIKLENHGEKKIAVTSVTCDHPAVHPTLKTVEDGKRYVIKVEVDPKLVKKDLRATLKITTDSEEQKVLSVSVYGIESPETFTR